MKLQELIQVSDEEKRAVTKVFNMTEGEFEDCLEILWDWYEKTEFYVDYITRTQMRNALMNSKGSIEKAKEIVRAYFHLKKVYSSFCDTLMPFTKEYNQSKSLIKFGIIPKLTPDLCRVFVLKFNDRNGEASDGMIYQVFPVMGIELKIKMKDYFSSNIWVVDLDEFSWRNMMKYTPAVNQVLLDILISLKLKIKGIHLVNPPPFIDKLLYLCKTILPTKLYQKVNIHTSYDSLYKFVPKECLPSNYDGSQPSLEELTEKWTVALENEEEYYKKLVNIKLKVKNKIESKKNFEQFGNSCEGSFRKLAID